METDAPGTSLGASRLAVVSNCFQAGMPVLPRGSPATLGTGRAGGFWPCASGLGTPGGTSAPIEAGPSDLPRAPRSCWGVDGMPNPRGRAAWNVEPSGSAPADLTVARQGRWLRSLTRLSAAEPPGVRLLSLTQFNAIAFLLCLSPLSGRVQSAIYAAARKARPRVSAAGLPP